MLAAVRLSFVARESILRRLVDDQTDLEILKSALSSQDDLSSVFDVPSRYPSRFRDWFDPGILYAALKLHTAMAETGYHRFRFLIDSPELSELAPAPLVETKVLVTGKILSTAQAFFDNERPGLEHSSDYHLSQRLGRRSREAGLDAIRYRSIREADRGACLAVLTKSSVKRTGNGDPQLIAVTRNWVEFRSNSRVVAFETAAWAQS